MIYIIIPVFNRKKYTEKCLESLRKQTYREFTIIVIDDGSSDGTAELIIKDYPEVVLIKGDGNLWWAGATNAGIEHVLSEKNISENDFILTLNNDLEVSETYLENMILASQLYKKSLIGSVSVDINNPDHMNFCGVKWNEFTAKYHLLSKNFNQSYTNYKAAENFTNSDTLPGRGTLIPILVFKQIGIFDSKNFPQYAADEDFTLRAKRKGWSLLILPSVVVKSHIDATGINSTIFNFSNFKQLFFSIKSPLNLKTRYRWAVKNTRLKQLYFLLETMRTIISLVLKKINRSF